MRGAVRHVDENRLDFEGNGAVLGEHGCYHVDNDVTDISYCLQVAAYSLVLSVAVVSMKMFVVLPGTILESTCQLLHSPTADVSLRCELMIGGMDRT